MDPGLGPVAPDQIRLSRTKSGTAGPNPQGPEPSKSALHLISDVPFVSSRAYALTHAVYFVFSQVQVTVLVPFVKVTPRDVETTLAVVLVLLGEGVAPVGTMMILRSR